jgi:hypothetical protein
MKILPDERWAFAGKLFDVETVLQDVESFFNAPTPLIKEGKSAAG